MVLLNCLGDRVLREWWLISVGSVAFLFLNLSRSARSLGACLTSLLLVADPLLWFLDVKDNMSVALPSIETPWVSVETAYRVLRPPISITSHNHYGD